MQRSMPSKPLAHPSALLAFLLVLLLVNACFVPDRAPERAGGADSNDPHPLPAAPAFRR
jgi:hypothetical protein